MIKRKAARGRLKIKLVFEFRHSILTLPEVAILNMSHLLKCAVLEEIEIITMDFNGKTSLNFGFPKPLVFLGPCLQVRLETKTVSI